jgi:cytochrome c oxidase assembly factor CtaG
MPQMTFLALAIYSSSRPLYRHYVGLARGGPARALADQRLAGGLMWIVGDLTLLGGVLVVAGAWAAHEQRVTARREQLEDLAAARRAAGAFEGKAAT